MLRKLAPQASQNKNWRFIGFSCFFIVALHTLHRTTRAYTIRLIYRFYCLFAWFPGKFSFLRNS